MAIGKVINKEELLTGLKDEERELRKLNDSVHQDNGRLKKENKGLIDKNDDLGQSIKRQREVLGKLDRKVRDDEDKIRVNVASLNKKRREIDDLIENCTKASVKAEKDVLKLVEVRKGVDEKKSALKSRINELEEGERALEKKEKDITKELVRIDDLREDAVHLVAEKHKALSEVELEKDKVAKVLAETKDVKSQYLDKKKEVEIEKQEMQESNKQLKKMKESLTVILEEAEKGKKAIAIKEDLLLKDKKALTAEYKELDTLKQEIEIERLRVQKIIKEKNVGKELAKLKKDLG